MALSTFEKDPIQVSANTITHRDQENGLPRVNETISTMPRWPRYVAIASHLLVVVFSIIIIALVPRTLHSYSETRNIRFHGIDVSWPADLNLQPAYFFLAVSSLSILFSLASCIYTLVRRNADNFSNLEMVCVVMSVVMLGLWVAGDIIQHQSEKSPRTDILKWSCRRRDGPNNALVSYASTCNAQVSPSSCSLYLCLSIVGSYQGSGHSRRRGTSGHLSQLASNILLHEICLKKCLDTVEDKTLSRMLHRASCCQRYGSSANILRRLVMFHGTLRAVPVILLAFEFSTCGAELCSGHDQGLYCLTSSTCSRVLRVSSLSCIEVVWNRWSTLCCKELGVGVDNARSLIIISLQKFQRKV